jgi:triosephosphate isomerase (TIM)
VIIGHSERRALHGETNEQVAAKVSAALAHGLIPVICVGETAEDREAHGASAVPVAQLRAALASTAAGSTVVVAYEPVWAIGTGLTPTTADVEQVHRFIREKLTERFKAEGDKMRILYGGSVKPSNAKELMAVANVNGALVGGASLKASDFLAIAAGC